MMHKHCAFCGNLNLRSIDDSIKKCPRCNWEGVPDRNSMEDINKLARGYRPGNKAPLTRAAPKNIDNEDNLESIQSEDPETQEDSPQTQRSTDPRKSSFRMDDKEASTSENRLAGKQISDKSPKNRELIERLKNKSIRGADFM